MLLITCIIFVVFGSGVEEWWNDPKKVKSRKNQMENGEEAETKDASSSNKL